jgi:hypothetical protein
MKIRKIIQLADFSGPWWTDTALNARSSESPLNRAFHAPRGVDAPNGQTVDSPKYPLERFPAIWNRGERREQ